MDHRGIEEVEEGRVWEEVEVGEEELREVVVRPEHLHGIIEMV